MAEWREDLPVVDSRTLPPDPQLMESIGLNHAFESAIADLVDNSIDAGAGRILIRFVREGDRLVGLYVVDDGRGMDDETIDRAMTMGSRRTYEEGDLGHFGIGLKASSLGQAQSLSVFSRADDRSVGRRWLIERATTKFECDVLDPGFAASELDRDWSFVTPSTGTVVRWDRVKSFPSPRRADVVNRYLEATIMRVRQHLGLVFHRLLEVGRVMIGVDVEDFSLGETGVPFLVESIDPFAYLSTGHRGYPKTLNVDVEGATVDLVCHIWPGRSQLSAFRLPGSPPDKFQGFFFYRADRLLQPGGWNRVTHPERHYQLARVAIDTDGLSSDLFSMNPEKTRLEAHEGFVRSVLEAESDGFSISTFLDDAARVFKESRKRDTSRKRVFPPGKGLVRRVRRSISHELDFLPGESPIDIRWARFDGNALFDIDRVEGVIWLNKRYRAAINRDRRGALNDAPLVKALLYLLLEDLFHGAFLGAKDKDNIELWDAILTAAAEAELNDT